ncbi:hypothetical protein [Kolteria novifilia]
MSFAIEGITYTETLDGIFRAAVDALARYELHVGEDAATDLTADPDETFSSLPHTTTLELDPGHVYYVVTNRRNAYDMASQVGQTETITIDSGGDSQTNAPSAPTVQSFGPGLSGAFSLQAIYYGAADTSPADTWLIYFTSDGSDPDPGNDTPTEVAMNLADGAAYLDWSSSTFAGGTTGKVIVRAQRSSDSVESANTTIYTSTNDAIGFGAQSGGIFYRRVAEQT